MIDIKDVLDVTFGAIIWICSHFHAGFRSFDQLWLLK